MAGMKSRRTVRGYNHLELRSSCPMTAGTTSRRSNVRRHASLASRPSCPRAVVVRVATLAKAEGLGLRDLGPQGSGAKVCLVKTQLIGTECILGAWLIRNQFVVGARHSGDLEYYTRLRVGERQPIRLQVRALLAETNDTPWHSSGSAGGG